MDDRSVSGWIAAAKGGSREAAEKLFSRYYDELVRVARRRLAGRPMPHVDGEDIALSAFKSFCLAAADGKLEQLDDRDQLWALLVTISARKVSREIRANLSQKRGAGQVLHEADLAGGSIGQGLDQVSGRDLSPDVHAAVVDEVRHMLDTLGDESLRRIALWKLDGLTNEEIAKELGVVVTTVERKLGRIREKWSRLHKPK